MCQYKKLISTCPICDNQLSFNCVDDFWSCRDGLRAKECPYGSCVTRERAVGAVLFSYYTKSDIKTLSIHESAPAPRGISAWLNENVTKYISTGYYPSKPRGLLFSGFRNENLEDQTFADGVFDIVLHLDVMEHLFNPFQALREIYRTLKHGGICIFTAPTENNRFTSEQVAFLENGILRTVDLPEYHGNPQNPEEGSLVTWRYGYDLPYRISQESNFDVEVRRWQDKSIAVMGYMTEIYILKKH